MKRMAILAFLAGFLACLASENATKGKPQLYVAPLSSAESFKIPNAPSDRTDAYSVEMGRAYLHSRLARPDRQFICTTNPSNVEYRLQATVSALRSRENAFRGVTYGHHTKTTLWQLDVIVELLKGDVVVFSKTRTSSYEERRPISESQFDNNIFHNLMTAALEQVADDVVDFFEPESDEENVAGSGGRMSGSLAGTGAVTSHTAADPRPSLAVLKPEAGAGVSEQEAAQLWDFIESSVSGGAFRIISRSDLARMQEEIGFTTSSDLVDLASRDRARIGKIKTVSKVLLASVGRIGETFTLAIKVFDSSTAEIDASRSRSRIARSIDAFLPILPALLAEVLAAPPSGTVLIPAARPALMPKSVAAAFDAVLAQKLAAAGVAVKAGTAGGVRIVPSIAAYSVVAVQEVESFVYRGSVSGSIRVEGADVAPVTFALDDVELGREQGAAPSWLTENYGKKLVAQALKAESVRNWLAALTNLK